MTWLTRKNNDLITGKIMTSLTRKIINLIYGKNNDRSCPLVNDMKTTPPLIPYTPSPKKRAVIIFWSKRAQHVLKRMKNHKPVFSDHYYLS